MFGVMYVLKWNFSFKATALTCLYFLAMLFYAIRRNNKWISKITLYDLLYYERQNEKKLLHDGESAIALFFISVLTGCAGFILMCAEPLGNGYDVLIGIACLVLFLFGFFLSVPEFIIMQFGNREKWKYEKNRLVPAPIKVIESINKTERTPIIMLVERIFSVKLRNSTNLFFSYFHFSRGRSTGFFGL